MSDTTFIDFQTPVVSLWLNDVNDTVYTALGSGGVAPATPAQVAINIGAVTLPTLAAPGGAALLGWQRAGGLLRTADDKFQESVSVFDFMSTAEKADVKVRTLSLDVTTAIQTAISSLTTGQTLLFPAGTYKITSGLTISVSGVKLKGMGRAASIISVTGSSYDAFAFTNTYSGIYDLGLTSPSIRTAGAGISFDTTGFANEVINVNLFNQFKAIYLGSVVVPFVDRVYIRNCGITTGGGIHINGGNDQYLSNVIMDNDGTQPAYGLWVQKSAAVWATACDFIRSGTPVKFQPGPSEEIDWCFFDRVAADTSTGNGYLFDAQATSLIKGCTFVGCWSSSNTLKGVSVVGAGTIDGLDFTSFRALNNGLDGISVASATAKNVRINGGSFCGNSQTVTHINSGIEFGVNVSDFSVIGAKCGNALGFSGTTQQRGIIVQAGTSDRYTITGNDLIGNNSVGLLDNGSGTDKSIIGNRGYTTRSGGTGTIAIGTNTIAITHNLAVTPTADSINITPTQHLGASGIASYVITSLGATTFNVTSNVNVATNAFTFGWNARIAGA